jgi:hypothetical protein
LWKNSDQNKENLAAMKLIFFIIFFFWPLVASKPQIIFAAVQPADQGPMF